MTFGDWAAGWEVAPAPVCACKGMPLKHIQLTTIHPSPHTTARARRPRARCTPDGGRSVADELDRGVSSPAPARGWRICTRGAPLLAGAPSWMNVSAIIAGQACVGARIPRAAAAGPFCPAPRHSAALAHPPRSPVSPSKLSMDVASQPACFHIKCGRCGVIFAIHDCLKLEHFSIYRAVCPHCCWPGRYLASELHAGPAAKPVPRPAIAPKPCQ